MPKLGRLVKRLPRKVSCSGRRDLDPINRFWLQTDKKGPEDCWVWLGYYRAGRPVISVKGKQIKAAAFAYGQILGKVIPKGMGMLHTCDNPACVNPNHIFPGTQQDNVQDMVNKNRHHKPKGTLNGRAKLTESDVKFIRANCRLRHPTLSQRALAKQFGVCTLTIQEILNGKKWGHVK